jgi:4-hydroxy-4-methyl-2-oxoglutarate aldolase
MEEAAIIRSLGEHSAATLHEVMGQKNMMWPSIQPLWRPLALCGPAFTVRARPGDNLAVHWALAVAPAGMVLVVTHDGDNACGAWGEITSTAALARGLFGLITDGAVRDSEACRQLGLPIFSQGVSIRGATKMFPGELNVPIVSAGALVRPGDIVVADVDGIVVVPRDDAEVVLQKANERVRRETEVMERLRAGEVTLDLLGFRARLPAP